MSVIGVLGLGTMGRELAVALAAAGHDVVGNDCSPAAADAARAAGLTVADSIAAATATAGLVVLSLPGPAVVGAVIAELASPTLVVDTSTVGPAAALEFSVACAARGSTYVEAPILGRPGDCLGWTLLLGGPDDGVTTAMAALEPAVGRVREVGGPGAAATMKVLNNLMFCTINAVTAEVLATLEACELDAAAFVEAVAGSRAGSVSGLFKEVAPRMLAGDVEPRFSVDLLAKDAHLARELVSQHLSEPLLATVTDVVSRRTADAGLGAQDCGAVIDYYRSVTRSHH